MRSNPLVLIADDDGRIREALLTRLSQSGFEVLTAATSKEAVVHFDHRSPDAAILDVEMPDSDGLAVCEHIRSSGSTIPVFILTGSDAGIIRNHLDCLTSAVGANHFISKPYDGKSLVNLLHDAIQANRQAEAIAMVHHD